MAERKAWADKRVVVTGGAGMLGSHLVELLLEREADVAVMDDLSRGQWQPAGLREVHVADAGDVEVCMKSFRGAEVVFNLAAHVAGVLYNRTHSAEMFHRNARLQTAPAIAAAQVGVETFVQVSSVCVYAPLHQAPIEDSHAAGHEGEPHAANAGYAWAKRVGERAALMWADIERPVVVRPVNMYGPRDYFDDKAHVIPALIKRTLRESAVELYGTGNETREFLYVEDAARGLMAAAQRGAAAGTYVLGTSGRTRVAIRDLALLIQTVLEVEKPVEVLGGDGGDPHRWSDCSRTEAALEWQAETSLPEGLRKTIAWYREQV